MSARAGWFLGDKRLTFAPASRNSIASLAVDGNWPVVANMIRGSTGDLRWLTRGEAGFVTIVVIDCVSCVFVKPRVTEPIVFASFQQSVTEKGDSYSTGEAYVPLSPVDHCRNGGKSKYHYGIVTVIVPFLLFSALPHA